MIWKFNPRKHNSEQDCWSWNAGYHRFHPMLLFALVILLPAPAAFAAKKLPNAVLSPVLRISDIDGGGTYECPNAMAELMDLMGDAWRYLPQDMHDELMRSLNRRYTCDGGGWGWLEDLGSLIEDVAEHVEDFGQCMYDILSDIDDIDYDTLADAVYENGGSCYWKEKQRLECSVRDLRFTNPDWRCVRASNFTGSCISSSDLAASFAAGGLNQCLELDADAMFCDDEHAPMGITVYLSTSNVSLDCNGRTITGMPGGAGFRAPYEESISDINVRSCRIQDTDRYGIDLKRFFRGTQLDGDMPGHRDITFQGTSIINPGQIGVYVGQNSRNIRLRDLEIHQARVAGIYLESGSTHTEVSNGAIVDTQPKSGGADPGAAIAIDSSQHNTIERIRFDGNRGGDIKLYKNCGENYGQVCPIRRPLAASHNVIRFNDFSQGISVASRQFKLYGPAWCAGIDVAGFWRDHSSDNLIYANRFHEARLDIQDGPNRICGNDFLGGELELGKNQPAGFIDQPVHINGVVAENAFDASSVVDVRTQGVFDDLAFFGNRDPQTRCLDLPDVCTGEEASSIVEVVRYWECVDLRNECSGLTTPRDQAAAQACGVPVAPALVARPTDDVGVASAVGGAEPVPHPGTLTPPTSWPAASRVTITASPNSLVSVRP